MEKYSALLTRREDTTAVRKAFLIRDQEEWKFPVFIPNEEIYNADPLAANRAILEQLGVAVTTRYALRVAEKRAAGALNIYVTEPRSHQEGGVPGVEGWWVERADFPDLSFVYPKEQALLKAWFAEEAQEPMPTLDIPWWREGWFEEAAGWLAIEASKLGRLPIAPVEQMRCASTSAILKVRSEAGPLYMKAVPTLFAHEIALTQALGEQDPVHFPCILRTEGNRMLQEEMQGEPLGQAIPLARWEAVVDYYARMQVRSAANLDQWQRLGCMDLRMQGLTMQLEEVLMEAAERLHGLPQLLSEEEEAQLRALVPALRERCIRLLDYGVPDALEHGDLHAGNIRITEDSFRIFDWSHACITCPFYGFGSLFLHDDWFPDQPELLIRLRDLYLDPWKAFVPKERVIAAFEEWKPLQPLFTAAHQSQIIGSYWKMLGEQHYLPVTATGNAIQYMQWWLAASLRSLLTLSGIE